MKTLKAIVIFFFFNIGFCFSADSFIPLSSVNNSLYQNHLDRVIKSAISLAESEGTLSYDSELDLQAENEKLPLNLDRIGFRLGFGLKIGVGPFSIKGEMQHRFIFKLP